MGSWGNISMKAENSYGVDCPHSSNNGKRYGGIRSWMLRSFFSCLSMAGDRSSCARSNTKESSRSVEGVGEGGETGRAVVRASPALARIGVSVLCLLRPG